ncbi:MAG: hypothetical protein ABGZ35_05245 [Planctomycetaceae bacterium]
MSNSLAWLFVVVAMFVTSVGWAFLANSYVISNHTAGSQLSNDDALGKFIAISIGQLPNLSSVITWHIQNRLWLLILVVLAEIAVIGGYWLSACGQLWLLTSAPGLRNDNSGGLSCCEHRTTVSCQCDESFSWYHVDRIT